jgi:hypothetical protein
MSNYLTRDPKCPDWLEKMKSRLLLLALILTPITASAQSIIWNDYVVPETGAVAQIPTTIFSQDGGQVDEGYGRSFVSSDGKAKLTVQSIPNNAGDSPAAFLAKKNPPPNIVYRKVASNFFAVSSFRGDKIWYNRCNFSGGFVNCVLINYPAIEKRKWDDVVTRISNTLASRQ